MLATLAALALIAQADPPKPDAPSRKEELAAITGRGRDLAGYDAACWHASDALQAANPKPGSVEVYVARKVQKRWAVAFGKLDEGRDKFLVAYEATQGEEPDRFEVEAFDPPREDRGFYRTSALAIGTALKEFTDTFQGQRRPYNVAVLPADKGQSWVYLVPAPTRPNAWPLGGDARYLVSTDGRKIVEKRQLHRSIIELDPAPRGHEQVAGTHTHVLSGIPEDTDVFHVLSRKPRIAEVVVAEKFSYLVEPDGSIRTLGRTDELRTEALPRK